MSSSAEIAVFTEQLRQKQRRQSGQQAAIFLTMFALVGGGIASLLWWDHKTVQDNMPKTLKDFVADKVVPKLVYAADDATRPMSDLEKVLAGETEETV